VNLIHQAEEKDQWAAAVIMVMNRRFPWKAGNFLINWAVTSLSRTLICVVI
jgi:hypothetical protein